MSALQGLTVLDFSPLLPGPWASEQLREMGARVIRIESPKHPDLLRAYPHAFKAINGQKETWQLDLKSPDAIGQLKGELKNIDIVIEQFRPGVMKKLGLDFESLQAHNDQLIYCSITGYGQKGPLADKAGHDINYQALAGLASYGGSEQPVLTSVQVADIAGGSYPAIVKILAAIVERVRTGKGQYIDISMLDGAKKLNTMTGPEVIGGSPEPQPNGSLLNGGSFYDYYECADGQYIAFGGLEPKFYQAFCSTIDKPEWVSRFADMSTESQSGLKNDLRRFFKTRARDDWQPLFDADVCVTPVLRLSEVYSS
jgi:crotonobetainyl-CoA:carnitine CoA-transferase CaiB-like acyl-CoA transferase